MRVLNSFEEKALEDPAVLIGYFSYQPKGGRPGVEDHRTDLLRRLFNIAGEQQPAYLQQTIDDTCQIPVVDLLAVIKKAEALLKP
jgi:hypothetical protein